MACHGSHLTSKAVNFSISLDVHLNEGAALHDEQWMSSANDARHLALSLQVLLLCLVEWRLAPRVEHKDGAQELLAQESHHAVGLKCPSNYSKPFR